MYLDETQRWHRCIWRTRAVHFEPSTDHPPPLNTTMPAKESKFRPSAAPSPFGSPQHAPPSPKVEEQGWRPVTGRTPRHTHVPICANIIRGRCGHQNQHTVNQHCHNFMTVWYMHGRPALSKFYECLVTIIASVLLSFRLCVWAGLCRRTWCPELTQCLCVDDIRPIGQ